MAKDDSEKNGFADVKVIDPVEHFAGGNAAGDIIKAGGTLVKSQVEYQTAISVQIPRDLSQVVERSIKEAEVAGPQFYYAWEAKGDGGASQIEGESIEMAMALARNWGNCATPVELTEVNDKHFIFRAHFVDLETGFNTSRMFMQRRDQTIYGRMDDGRKEMIRFQIGQSKAIRNVILKALPSWLKESVFQAAKAAAMQDITPETLAKKRKDAVKTLGAFGVKQKHIETFLERALPQWTADDILALRGIYQRLSSGEGDAREIFGIKEDEKPKDKKKPPKVDAEANLEGNDPKEPPTNGGSPPPEDDPEAPPVDEPGEQPPPPGEPENNEPPEEPPDEPESKDGEPGGGEPPDKEAGADVKGLVKEIVQYRTNVLRVACEAASESCPHLSTIKKDAGVENDGAGLDDQPVDDLNKILAWMQSRVKELAGKTE